MNVEIHRRVSTFIREGLKLPEIDAFIAKCISEMKCKSAFYGYRKGMAIFPSNACLSVNDCIVHGTAGYYIKPLKPTDIIKIDIGIVYNGQISDLGWSYVVKEHTEQTKKITDCGLEAIRKGVEEIKYNNPISSYGSAVENVVKNHGFFCIEGLVGHYFGKKLHESPAVPNFFDRNSFEKFICGTVAVEPMIGYSTGKTKSNGWPVLTLDGSLSVHFEHNLLVEEEKTTLLSKEMENLPIVVG